MNLSSILHLQPPSYERKKHYEFGSDLGTGTYGTVKKAKALDLGVDVAVKIILKKTVKGHEDMVDKEIGVLKGLHHPNIVNFLDWFESRDKYYLVFDLASGGELFDKICDKGRFTENNAATIMKEVIEAIEYLHSKNVVHRDLKPENLLYKDSTPESKLMIVDFGISKTMESEDQILTTMCGSYGYAAPEVLLSRGHGKPVDMWSIGVITYTLLCGYAPFQAENDQQLVAEIARCNVVFHERYWRDVSVEARDFIKCLLRAQPEKRLTATEALQHKWITTETGADVDLLDNVKEGFNAKKVFKKTIHAVAAATRMKTMGRTNTSGTTNSLVNGIANLSTNSLSSTASSTGNTSAIPCPAPPASGPPNLPNSQMQAQSEAHAAQGVRVVDYADPAVISGNNSSGQTANGAATSEVAPACVPAAAVGSTLPAATPVVAPVSAGGGSSSSSSVAATGDSVQGNNNLNTPQV